MTIKHMFNNLTCYDKEFPTFTELPKSPSRYLSQDSTSFNTKQDDNVRVQVLSSIVNESKNKDKTNFDIWCNDNIDEVLIYLIFFTTIFFTCVSYQAHIFVTLYIVCAFLLVLGFKFTSLLGAITKDKKLRNLKQATNQALVENQAVKTEYHEIVKLRNKHKSLLESVKEDNVALTYENAWFMQSLPQKLDVIQECYSKTTSLRYSAKMLIEIDITIKQLTDTLDKIEEAHQDELASRISVELITIQRMQALNESVLDGNNCNAVLH